MILNVTYGGLSADVAELDSAANLEVSNEILLKEIAKCEVVCAVCHRIRTYKRLHKLP